MRSRLPIRVYSGIAILLAATTWIALRNARTEGRNPYDVEKVELRYAALLSRLPERGTVGYLRNPDSDEAAFGIAQYVLAPRILSAGIGPDLTIVEFKDAWRFEAFAQANCLCVVMDFGEGLFLVRKGVP